MSNINTYILAIESSCDDTAASVLYNDMVLSNCVANQEIHQQYGGVVPELASRAHLQNIIPVVDQAIKQAGIDKKQLHAVAYTKGPGLMGSLLVGSAFAQAFSMSLSIPLIAVNHMQAHILAHFIDHPKQSKPSFPFLALTISGGHTQIVLIRNYFDMEVIGQTLDDAVGEAFDKSAKILGLPYPGGPLVDKLAQEGNPKAFNFPIPKVSDLNFSFSGLKTSILYFVQKQTQENPDFVKQHLNDLCASIQYTIIQILMKKLQKAVQQTGVHSVAIGGGVSANSGIRTALLEMKEQQEWEVYIPEFEYTTDNAAMVGIVGYLKYQEQYFQSSFAAPNPRYQL